MGMKKKKSDLNDIQYNSIFLTVDLDFEVFCVPVLFLSPHFIGLYVFMYVACTLFCNICTVTYCSHADMSRFLFV